MKELDYLWAVVLGVVQGLTEFLPVSSSGHLALTQRWLGLNPASQTMLFFDVLVHVATLVAVFVVFAVPTARFLRRLRLEVFGSTTEDRYAVRIAGLALATFVPTAAIGLFFKDTLEQAFDKPKWIGGGLFVTGLLLAATALVPRPRQGWKKFSWIGAIFVGIAQGLAILPGVSRSGSTICVATIFGLRRRWSAQLSFLAAAPAILAAGMLKTLEAIQHTSMTNDRLAWGPLAVGSVVSLVVGVIALRILLRAVDRAKLHYFSPYCFILGALIWLYLD